MFEGSNGLEGDIPKQIANISRLKYMSLGKHTGALVILKALDLL